MSHSPDPLPPSSTVDPRAAKSGLALRTALLALLERKPFDQITVREICAEAGVHYATFFRHHPTKEALLDHVAADQIDRLVELTLPILDTADSQAAFVGLCVYVGEHRALWTTLLTGGAAAAMRAQFLAVSRSVAVERAPDNVWLPVELGVTCTVSLIVETLSWWLAQPAEATSVGAVARILHRLVMAIAPQESGGWR